MPKHKVGTREEWSAARKKLHEREQELGNLDEDLAKRRFRFHAQKLLQELRRQWRRMLFAARTTFWRRSNSCC